MCKTTSAVSLGQEKTPDRSPALGQTHTHTRLEVVQCASFEPGPVECVCVSRRERKEQV